MANNLEHVATVSVKLCEKDVCCLPAAGATCSIFFAPLTVPSSSKCGRKVFIPLFFKKRKKEEKNREGIKWIFSTVLAFNVIV